MNRLTAELREQTKQSAKLDAERKSGADREDADEYRACNIFWVPKEARWSNLKAKAKQPTIGKTLDDAMLAIERDNPSLKGVLPKDYARPALDKHRLGELIDVIGTIGLGAAENRSKDILGRVYEYFLTQFDSAEGKNGGQFYTPRCVVRVLVEMLAPYNGRVYDPCCGSAGMFVQSEKFVDDHGGRMTPPTSAWTRRPRAGEGHPSAALPTDRVAVSRSSVQRPDRPAAPAVADIWRQPHSATLEPSQSRLVGEAETVLVLPLRCRLPDLHRAEQRRAFDQQDKRKARDLPEAPVGRRHHQTRVCGSVVDDKPEYNDS